MPKDLTMQDVRDLLSRAVNGNQKAWATEHGMSGAYVSDTIAGRTDPGPKILDALGLEAVPPTYRRKKLNGQVERRG